MPRAAHRNKGFRWVAACLLAVAVAGGVNAARTVWLRWMGEFLVRAEAPQAADVAVVLAGDGYGHRVMRAVELARQGYVKQILVDGPYEGYDLNEADLAIAFAVRRGAPKEILVPVPMPVHSTVAEARLIDEELQKRKVSKALIVTSNFHTRRARSVFDRIGSRHIQYRVVASPDEDFSPEDWWLDREGKKVLFLEYVKLAYWWLGG